MNAQPFFENLAGSWMPRILTQIDRDPTASTFGCCDRNWWHYKIRDFPSIILQQAGYTALIASDMAPWSQEREGLRRLAAGSAAFWSRHVSTRKTFDEYYPWEQGYPPLAFSTLAVAKIAGTGAAPRETIEPGAAFAAKRLTKSFEPQAANQQVAGMAAMTWLMKLFPGIINERDADRVIERTLGLQTDEGWYWEYGGPDLGYLSVTIDCLIDAYDARADERFLASARRALAYIDRMTVFHGANIGMHNARNTDYIVPFGIARLTADRDPVTAACANRLIRRLYTPSEPSRHFLLPTDDRYICHYIGHSVMRALDLLRASGATPDAGEPEPEDGSVVYFKQSGHLLDRNLMISLHKGGIFSVKTSAGAIATDFGWSVEWKGRRYVSHWWSTAWNVTAGDSEWRVSGDLVPCREMISSPLKHIVLRVASRLAGSVLIRHLKKALIFKSHTSGVRLERIIRKSAETVTVEDRISGLPAGVEPEPAPRASKRHVASADSYQEEDFIPAEERIRIERSITREAGTWKAFSTYYFNP